MKSPQKRKGAALVGAGLLSIAILTACSSPAVIEESPENPEAAETHGGEARLVVGFPESVKVFDAETLDELASFPLNSSPYVAVASDARYVFALEHQDHRIHIVDTGTWEEPHGDHSHHHAADPSFRESIIGAMSYHAVSDEARTVVWNDDTGNIEVIDAEDFSADVITPRVIELEGIHHGVGVPLSTGFLVSFAVDDDAAGIARIDEAGAELERYEGCEGLHGETHVGTDSFAFGCKGKGIMLVNDSGATHIAAPIEGTGSSKLASDGKTAVIAGNLRAAASGGPDLSTSVALYDTAAGTSKVVDFGVKFSNMVVTEKQLVVIGTDGNLHLADLVTGEVRTIPAIDPWEIPAEFLDPRPMIAASHDHVWITDPMNGQIVAVDITDGDIVVKRVVGGEPDRLEVVGYSGDEHDHD